MIAETESESESAGLALVWYMRIEADIDDANSSH